MVQLSWLMSPDCLKVTEATSWYGTAPPLPATLTWGLTGVQLQCCQLHQFLSFDKATHAQQPFPEPDSL